MKINNEDDRQRAKDFINKSNILEQLDSYFKNTPKEEIDNQIKKINKMGTKNGIDVDEYFKMFLPKDNDNQNK